MYPHHQQSIENVIQFFKQDKQVQALLLGGSLAHGFAAATSDVDVMIVVSDEEYAKHLAAGTLTYFSRELCTYPEGYVDGKYITTTFLDRVRTMGSEPARFAFKDASILYSNVDGLAQMLEAIACYPRGEKIGRIQRFYAQLEAWHWYTGEAVQKANPYLLSLSASKLALFGGRLILAHNEMLYPYHKWFLRVLAQVQHKPEHLIEQIEQLTTHPDKDLADQFFDTLKNFRVWETAPGGWGAQFMKDSEINWMTGATPIDDL